MFQRDCGICLRQTKRWAVPRFSPQLKGRNVPRDYNLDPEDVERTK